jgi:hypothetical protein
MESFGLSNFLNIFGGSVYEVKVVGAKPQNTRYSATSAAAAVALSCPVACFFCFIF